MMGREKISERGSSWWRYSNARWWVVMVTLYVFTMYVMHCIFITFAGSRNEQKVYGSTNQAAYPPRGWNSFVAFSWVITEQEFLQNAQVMADKLLPFGYEYVTVDFLWYRKLEASASYIDGSDLFDQYGRPQPDVDRWPSSKGGQGFKYVADKVHNMGLKFGIHVMRGINLAAVANSLPIANAQGGPADTGRAWRTSDITVAGGECPWMPHSFIRVNTSTVGGKAFLQSLYDQYADWGVDYVKHDCVFGPNLVLDEITAVSQAIANTGRPMVYSVSPGEGVTPTMGQAVAQLVNMYRVSLDNWDNWNSLQPHFDISRDFANAGSIGVAQAQGGRSWPDQDVLPFGSLTIPGASLILSEHTYRFPQEVDSLLGIENLASFPVFGTLSHRDYNASVDRPCQLTADEQQTELMKSVGSVSLPSLMKMTLWAISKSPLMYGGDLRYLDGSTLARLTNPTVLDINSKSTKNKQLDSSLVQSNSARVWVALGSSGQWFVAFFNFGSSTEVITINLEDVKQALGGDLYSRSSTTTCQTFNVWSNQELGAITNTANVEVPVHGVVLYSLTCS